jgi:DNA-binding response OmpR family regulator
MGFNKILVVDDDQSALRMLFKILHAEGYEVFTTVNSNNILTLALKYKPSLIITDWDMPGFNGLEVVKAIRSNDQTKNIPVLMYTGKLTSVNDLKVALDAGANDFLRKPADEIEILARVKSQIRYYKSLVQIIELEKKISEVKISVLTNELEESNSHLISTKIKLLNSIRKQENLLSKIEELKKIVSDKNIVYLDSLLTELKSFDIEERWKEYEIVFSKLNSKFLDNLGKFHPELTSNERRMCIFIRSSLSNKDIASITLLSPDSVKKAKYRLKKKLIPDGNKELDEYIHSL